MNRYSAIEYNYTEYIHSLFYNRLSKLQGFYCREDVEEARNAVLKAKKDAYSSRLNDLRNICRSFDMNEQDLINDVTLLDRILTKQQLEETLLDTLYSLYTEVPSPADYMRRIVRRLAPEYKDDTVRTAILKKFISGGGFGWKAMKTDVVHDFAISRFTNAEKNTYEASGEEEKIWMILSKLDDSIFTLEKPTLSFSEQLHLMVKRMESLVDTVEICDARGLPASLADFQVADDTKDAICAIGDVFQIPRDENSTILDTLKAIDAICMQDHSEENEELISHFYNLLEHDFDKQMRNTYYRIRHDGNKVKIEKTAALVKTDRRDAKKKKSSGWELINLCDNFAQGRFITNNGNTRVHLYYFAFMFGMTIKLKRSDFYDPERDIVKNLFEDYYSDNLVRYLDAEYNDPKTYSSFEKEPTGDGINFKNFMEVIYLYYLYRASPSMTPGEQIDKAEKTIRACISAAEKQKAGENPFFADGTRTEVYRDLFSEMITTLDEKDLVPFIVSRYTVLTASDKKAPSRILVSSESVTAYDLIETTMEDLEEDFSQSYSHSKSFNSDRPDRIEDAIFAGNLSFDWKLTSLLEQKYGSDAAFMKVVYAIDERLKTEFNWLGSRKRCFLAHLLHILYTQTDTEKKIRMASLREKLQQYDPSADGAMVTECAELLMALGFDVERDTEKNGGSIFRLVSRSYEDAALNEIIKYMDDTYYINEDVLSKKFFTLIQDKLPTWKRVSRTQLLSVNMSNYIVLLNESEDIESFPELFEDFKATVNRDLVEARFQPLSERNILDLYVILSLYFYMIENVM